MSRADTLTLGLLAIDGAILSSLAGPMDVLRIAHEAIRKRPDARRHGRGK